MGGGTLHLAGSGPPAAPPAPARGIGAGCRWFAGARPASIYGASGSARRSGGGGGLAALGVLLDQRQRRPDTGPDCRRLQSPPGPCDDCRAVRFRQRVGHDDPGWRKLTRQTNPLSRLTRWRQVRPATPRPRPVILIPRWCRLGWDRRNAMQPGKAMTVQVMGLPGTPDR